MAERIDRTRRGQLYGVLAAWFFFSVGFQLFRGTFNNFLVERFGATGRQRGLLEAVREIPGLLTVGFAAIAVTIGEPQLGMLCMVAFAAALMGFARADRFRQLYPSIFLGSIGMHLFIPVRQSLLLALTDPRKRGFVLGVSGAVGAIAALIASGFVYGLVEEVDFSGIFLGGALFSLLGASLMLRLWKMPSTSQRIPLVIRRRYGLYYLLTLLAGCRRQIFVTFALFSLVKLHSTPTQTIALLVGLSEALNIILKPLLGSLVDRLGERRALMLASAIPALIFVGYATVSFRPLLYVLYWLDSACLGLDVARTTYLDKMAPEEDLLPSLSLGLTANHILAVPLPVIGGWLWDRISPRVTFLVGAMVAVVSLFSAAWVPRKGEFGRQRSIYGERKEKA